MKTPTVIYHWWAGLGEEPAYSNLAHPILLSIATLRAVNPTIPIKILDCSEHNQNWLHLQEKLNFDVVKSDFFLKKHYSDAAGYQLLSRMFDIRRGGHSQDPVIYCDSDVFWLRDPLPLSCDINKFCFDGYNSGFFYYDYESPIVQEMFEVFEAYTIASLRDKDFCNMIRSKATYSPWYYIWDEIILTYMNSTGLSKLFEIIPPEEHGLMRDFHKIDHSRMKMLHCNGMNIKNPLAKRECEKNYSRGLACLMFKELHDNLIKSLDEDDIDLIFTKTEIKDCLSNQTSLFDMNRIDSAKSPDGHYNFCTARPESAWFM